jgi:PAS domain-containing protein
MSEQKDCRILRSDTEALIVDQISRVQKKAAKMWIGYEQEALITIVRALDMIAIASLRDVIQELSAERDQARYFGRLGAVTALSPFLEKVADVTGGVPWGPVVPEFMDFAYSYLVTCGQLVHLRRMVRLERYGLSKSTLGDAGPVIEVEVDTEEFAQRFAMESVLAGANAATAIDKKSDARLRKRMRSYVESSDEWFIRYDNDWDIVQAYRMKAEDYGRNFIEREALPDDVRIGDRTFKEWRDASNQALGRVLCHIDFATELQLKIPNIALANVATIFARKEDVEAVLVEAGIPRGLVRSTMRALTFSADTIRDWDWEDNFEVPCPYYIELGRDFVLLPCFGALSNPYVSFFRHLKAVYKDDWDHAVDEKEKVFRRDLASAFSTPRFHVPSHGFSIRRPNGSELTDIDAAIVDTESGSIAFVQLKWNDVFGHSLNEWQSRRRNVVKKANEWVEKLVSWIDGRSASEVARQLNIKGVTSDAAPLIYVVTRYIARFSGEDDQDCRAAWLSWFELLHVLSDLDQTEPLGDLQGAVVRHVERFVFDRPRISTFRFSDLTVELRMSWRETN